MGANISNKKKIQADPVKKLIKQNPQWEGPFSKKHKLCKFIHTEKENHYRMVIEI